MTSPKSGAQRQAAYRKRGKPISVVLRPEAQKALERLVAGGETIAGAINRVLVESSREAA